MFVPPDRGRILQQAQLLSSRGQYEAAIAEWKKLANDNPSDGSIHNTIGDLHLKRNVPADAAAAYLQAASAFRAEGATLKAIAAFKKVLKCDPTRYEVYRHLGDLNVERGLTSSAVQDYLTLGKYYLKERRGKDALEVYKKIITHDPSNLNAQQRVAELCVQENQQDEATKVYLQLGREKSAQGRYDEAKDAYLAVLKIDPQNSEAAQFVESLKQGGNGSAKTVKPTASASTLKFTPTQKPTEPVDLLAEAVRRITEKQYNGAEAILNQLLTREPGNPQVCQLLARLHLQRGDVQVAVGEYRFLAGAALRARDLDLAESLIQEVLVVEPNSVPLLELNGELYEEKGNHAEAAFQYAKAVEVLLAHPEPGMESLHEELFEKVKTLSTDADFVNRLAERVKKGATGTTPGEQEDVRIEEASIDQQAAVVKREPVEQETQEVVIVGAEPDAVSSSANIFTRDDESSVLSAAPGMDTDPQEEQTFSAPIVAPPVMVQETQPSVPPLPLSASDRSSSSARTSAIPATMQQGMAKEPAEPPPDYETYYALGVAYKNMGLYDEAQSAFRISMGSDPFYLDSALMTAICLKDEQQLSKAIVGLEAVLADPRCQGAKGQAIRYQLGLLYEAQEQWEKAARAFQAIPSFHDVPQRLAALKGKQQGGDIGFRYAS
ncbi:MAG: tetratricopeptide repeat protein [Nitrospira sp.]|nr:tetratricopeptide repeat protein [Nitrospira sp.]